MAVLLATFNVVVFYCESIMLLYQALQHDDDDDRTCFAVLVSIFVTSQLLTNTTSALLISSNMDFRGKTPGRLLCMALHLGQQGVIWRLGKIVMFYDQKDWLEFVLLRMIGISVQTLPYLAIQSYLLLTTSDDVAISIISMIVSLTSASVGLTSFTVRNHVHAASWATSSRRTTSSKKHCGFFLLLLGSTFGLASRICSIILMCVEKFYWVAVPLGLHVSVFLLVSLLTKTWIHQILSWKDVTKQIVFSYLNMFDLVDECFSRIQCKYVLYYTVILIENIIMTAVWMMSSRMDYTIKIVIILSILTCFICSLILKFTAGGLLFRSTSYVSSFENTLDVKPEEYVDNLSRQQISSISETVCETTNGTNLHAIDNTLYMDFGLPVIYSENTSTSSTKPWDFTHGQEIERSPKQNSCSNYPGEPKCKIINVVNFFESPVTVSRCQTDLCGGVKHPVIRCYNTSLNNESNPSLANMDLHSSNSRNTNTLAASNVTSSQVSNENPTEHSRLRLKKCPKTIMSIIKKGKLQRKHKLKLFSPSDDLFSCETDSELVCRKDMETEQPCVNIKICKNGIEEFIWDADITSVGSSVNENEMYSKTISFTTDSSRSESTWPVVPVGYFNPNVLPKENPISTESIKHWLSDVHRHTQDIIQVHHDITDCHKDTHTCHRDMTERNTSSSKVTTDSNAENSNTDNTHSVEDNQDVCNEQEDTTKGGPSFTGGRSSSQHRVNHSSLNHVHCNSPSMPVSGILNSKSDDRIDSSSEESCSNLSVSSEGSTNNTAPSSGDLVRLTPSIGKVNYSKFNTDGSVDRTFSSASSLTQSSAQNGEQASLHGPFPTPTMPFSVKLDNMESLV